MARNNDEESPDSLVPSETAPPTVLRSSSTPPDAKQKVRDLRKLTPSPDVRRETPLGSGVVDWVAMIKPSEAIRRAVLNGVAEPAQVLADDKILVAQPQDEPAIIYLERTDGGTGDSGWVIGVGRQMASSGYTAIRVAELVQACPDLTDILSLPAGCLVLMDVQEATEALFDADDNLLWSGADSDSTAPDENAPREP